MNQPTEKQNTLPVWRFRMIYLMMAALLLFFGWRLFDLQVANSAQLMAQAQQNRTAIINVPTQRGIIYDRNGFVLARNIASYNVVITPAYLPDDPTVRGDSTKLATNLPASVQEVYRKLSDLIDIPVSQGEINEETVKIFKPCENDLGLTQIVFIADTNSPYTPVNIKCNIPEELAMTILAKKYEMPGVDIAVESVRDYPTGSLTATVIGFLGPVPAGQEDYYSNKGFVSGRDKVGYAGIEATLQDVLGGQNGSREVEVDVSGKEIRNITDPIDPVPGNNLVLTLDSRLQAVAQEALISEINFWALHDIISTNGVVIAIKPKTGEILAMVTFPTYENNRMARQIPAYYYTQLTLDPDKPLFNHAISAEHPPGSVFKLPTAVGALNEHVVTPQQKLNDPGEIIVVERTPFNTVGKRLNLVCWEEAGHGDMDWLHGMANSCDVYYYKIGGGFAPDGVNGLGIWKLAEYARALGYDQRTGIELPGEASGLIPDPDWKRLNQGESWTIGDTYIASMGQGLILSTPLQVLVSAAILSFDGKYMQPTMIREIQDPNGNVVKPFQPVLKWDVTKDPLIKDYDENDLFTGQYKTIEPWIIDLAKQGMRMVVTEGTAKEQFADSPLTNTAGKTGTAEYCDNIAREKGLCERGKWPAHAWYFGYAPYDDPEIAVVAFVYNGSEGSRVAAPIVRTVLEKYFELKAIDEERGAAR